MKRRTFLNATTLLLGTGVSPVLLQAVQKAHGENTDAMPDRVATDEYHGLLQVLVEHIIPGTDTPGAHEAGVADYIEFILQRGFDELQREKFLSGLQSINEKSNNVFGQSFVAVSSDQQEAILGNLEQESERQSNKPGFFHTLKELTIIGYYTSEVGAINELRYLPVPGIYDACRQLEHGEAASYYNNPFDS